LLRELATLAPCEVRVDAKWIPPLTELDPEECRLSWRIEVNGPVKESAIKAVFDWVEGECDLKLEAFGPAPDATVMAPALAMPEVQELAAATPVVEEPPTLAPVAPPIDESLAPRNNAASTQAAAAAASATSLPSAAAGDGGSIRVSIEKIDELLNSVGELVITQSVLSQLAAPLQGLGARSCAMHSDSSSGTCAICRKASCACACCPSASYSIVSAPGARSRPAARQEDRAAPQR
jgi:two-component system chemotaxis sensor kinase CheA